MKRIKKYILTIILIGLILITTGCKQDNMEDIKIIVTNYAKEYIASKIYSKHATITSIYPDGTDIRNYNITKKQKQDFASYDLFIYNGLDESERKLAVELLDINSNLRIIDVAYVLETEYSVEELWLNPSSLLMMSNNLRMGLNEYLVSNYLKKEVNENYDNLKITLSEIDADYRVAVEEANKKTILVANRSLKYLTKFGINVLVLDEQTTEKELYDIKELASVDSINHIYKFKNDQVSEQVQAFASEYGVSITDLSRIDNLTDAERDNNKNYIDLMQDNLDALKLEMYQ